LTGKIVKIIIAGFIAIVTSILLIGFVPNKVSLIKKGGLFWVAIFIFFLIIGILFTQVYPIDSNISYKKIVFSMFIGLFFFILLWMVNGIETVISDKAYCIIFFVCFSLITKFLGALFIGYVIFSLIVIIS
jgi:hypothetical protein